MFAAAVSGWLTESVCYRVLWPEDVNATLVQILGGDVQVTLAGQAAVVLPWYSVFIRIALTIAILIAVGGWGFHRRAAGRRESSVSLLKNLTIVLGASSAWWGIWLLAEMGFLKAGELALGLLPVWFMVTVAGTVWLFGRFFLNGAGTRFKDMRRLREENPSSNLPWFVLLVATIGWVGISYWLNWALYNQLMIPHGDSAMYEEHLWNVWHGKGFRSYLDQGLFLGEHIQVIHLLLLPLHFFWPSHLLLELSESVALGGCSLIIFAITKRQTGSQLAAMWMGLAWLCYFPMHFLDVAIDQKTFRPIVLGLPFLFGIILYGEQGRVYQAAICLILALSAKEDIALVACPVLAVLALRCRSGASGNVEHSGAWKFLMGLSIGTAVYLVVTVLVIIPAFRSGEHVHYARYFGALGNTPGELIRTAVHDPLAVIAQAMRVQTMVYVAVLLAPLALLPVRRLWVLSAGLVTFGMLSLLQFSTAAAGLPPVPYHHFHAPLLPVVFWAAICGLSRFGQFRDAAPEQSKGISLPKRSRFSAGEISALAFCCCLLTAFTGSLSPLGATFWSERSSFGYSQLYSSADEKRQERVASIGPILAQIPETARVASTDYVHTRLTHYERSYDYSDYLRAVNDYQLGVPGDTDFIVLDLAHPYSRIRSVSEVPELTGPETSWQLRADLSNDSFLVLERNRVALEVHH